MRREPEPKIAIMGRHVDSGRSAKELARKSKVTVCERLVPERGIMKCYLLCFLIEVVTIVFVCWC